MMLGATAFTRIDSLFSSSARHRVIDATAALDVLYAIIPPTGTSAGRAATLTMRPPEFARVPFVALVLRRIAFIDSRQQRKHVSAFTSYIFLKSSADVFS